MTRRAAWILAAVLLAGCGDDGDKLAAEGEQCGYCRSTTPSCNAGLSCQRFRSDFEYSLCASPGTQSCPVPF